MQGGVNHIASPRAKAELPGTPYLPAAEACHEHGPYAAERGGQ
jgi:hypothetical protein